MKARRELDYLRDSKQRQKSVSIAYLIPLLGLQQESLCAMMCSNNRHSLTHVVSWIDAYNLLKAPKTKEKPTLFSLSSTAGSFYEDRLSKLKI